MHMDPQPLALYLHVPFCIHKCSYCDFFSIGVGDRAIPAERYMARAVEELRRMIEQYQVRGRRLHSIFFGGGTPSMIPPVLLGDFLAEAARQFALPDGLEITCEANPETVTTDRVRELMAVGMTRLSIGIQSFQPRFLHFLERVHSADRAIAAVRSAQDAGVTNINIDLIFGMPGQTSAELADDLDQALQLQTPHVAAYHLTVEAGTGLAAQVRAGKVQPIDEDTGANLWTQVRTALQSAGLPPYEISNYARPGFACAHNQHYWRAGEYLGIGTGAVSRIRTQRWRRARQLVPYLAGQLAVDEEESLTESILDFETTMLGLRTTEGIPAAWFDARYPGRRHEWIAAGWAEAGSQLRMTVPGWCILDEILPTIC